MPAVVEPDDILQGYRCDDGGAGLGGRAAAGEHVRRVWSFTPRRSWRSSAGPPFIVGRGSVQLCGVCRNMTDHRYDGKTVGTDIALQLR